MSEILEKVKNFVKEEAIRFGATYNPDERSKNSFLFRDNTKDLEQSAFFGFVEPEEQERGPYHDFSLVIFPNNSDNYWLIGLGVGTLGFKNDYNLALTPGLRRQFLKIVNDDGYCKSNFADIETSLPTSFKKKESLEKLKKTLASYTNFISVTQILKNPLGEEEKKIISAFIASYAKIREWPTNKTQRDAVSAALKKFESSQRDDELEVANLIEQRKYIILEGPPGTGKTRLSKNISNQIKAEKIFFTQFHAEITYSDFVYGIKPSLSDNQAVTYEGNEGSLIKSIIYAKENQNQKVILIIDEINRANLSNVLGPVFYLFEHKQDNDEAELEIAPGLKINKMPENLYVIGTMNTADRSLAVVDFALRRRFAWYQLYPQLIDNEKFMKEDFLSFKQIFDWYANSEELQLQPGQGYFLADTEDEMLKRIRYELYPLINEYLREGLLANAKEEFNKYFIERIKLPLEI